MVMPAAFDSSSRFLYALFSDLAASGSFFAAFTTRAWRPFLVAETCEQRGFHKSEQSPS